MTRSNCWFLKLRHTVDGFFFFIFFPFSAGNRKLFTWIRYYICLCKAAPFVSGLVFSHKLVDYAVVAVLITYFTDTWRKDNLRKAAAIVNVQEGLSAVMVIVMTYISDTFVGRLKVILFSTSAYIIGLVLLWFTAIHLIPQAEVGLVYVIIVVLIAVGKAGGKPILEAFLDDQLRAHEPSLDKDEDRVEARRNVWWHVAWVLSAIFTPRIFFDSSWQKTFICSASVMWAAYFLFFCGIPLYHPSEPTGSQLTVVFRVFKAAFLKKRLDDPCIPNQFFKNDENRFFRWLDKAAIIGSSSVSPEEQEKEGRLCTVTEVKEVKLLLTMIPMWAAFLGFGLVLSTANTFFSEQGNNMDLQISIVSLLILRSISSAAISFLYDLLLSKLVPEALQKHGKIVRIWVGMVLAIFCCSVAWRVEVHRLKIVNEKGLLDEPKEMIPMSTAWLVPQFCLLGLMEGLAKNGLDDFFGDQVSKSMEDYGSAINEFFIGIGSFLNVLCVYVFRSWFADTLNRSRLDKYYRMLTVVSLINLCFYWYVSTIYTHKKAAEEDVEQPKTAVDFV